MNLTKFDEQSDMTRDGVSLPIKVWYSFLGFLIKARDKRRRRNMPEFSIEIHLTKVLGVKADNIQEAKDKAWEEYKEGLHDTWGFDCEVNLYETNEEEED